MAGWLAIAALDPGQPDRAMLSSLGYAATGAVWPGALVFARNLDAPVEADDAATAAMPEHGTSPGNSSA